MFAVVANGLQTICKTQRQLDAIISLYPYPKFRRCNTIEDARKWIRENKRVTTSTRFSQYGETAITGYAVISYEIKDGFISYEIDTQRVGYIRIKVQDNVLIESRKDLLRVNCLNTKLDDQLIAHHAVAIRRILKLLGEFVDVDIVVPDISVYLALTKYSGRDFNIKGAQHDIASRLGAVSLTVRQGVTSVSEENTAKEGVL